MADELDLVRRELCPDGACIGVIGPDGRCKECGAVAPSVMSDARNRGLRPRSEDDAPPDGFDDRELCPDELCVGVIGDDGRCGECGRGPAAALAAAVAAAPASTEASSTSEDDFENRRLCGDEMCVGLIGPDGVCKECGRRAG